MNAEASAASAGEASLSFVQMIYGGAAMGASLMVPGMSASVILMLLGLYTDLLFAADAIMRGQYGLLAYIAAFALCMFAAVILVARFIKRAFERIPAIAYAVVLGFIVGSCVGIGYSSLQLNDVNFNWFMGAATFFAGTAVSIFFAWMHYRREQKNPEAATADRI